MKQSELIWKTFNEKGWESCECLWVSNFEKVNLIRPNSENFKYVNQDNCIWAEAKIDYPEVPKKTPHRCDRTSYVGYECYYHCCIENEDILTFHSVNKKYDTRIIVVEFCPFCGYKPGEK